MNAIIRPPVKGIEHGLHVELALSKRSTGGGKSREYFLSQIGHPIAIEILEIKNIRGRADENAS